MRLKLLTYNIHRAIGMDRRFKPERIADIVAHHEPDIALLQEVDDESPRSGGLDLAQELIDHLDFEFWAVGLNPDKRKGRWGNATLSRYPILRERNINLSIESRVRRGCQHTTIRVPHRNDQSIDVEVFNLHLGLSAQERARQIGMLVKSREFSACDPFHPCIVGGDFNDWRSLLHPIFTEILGFGCCTQPPHGYKVGVRTFPSISPRGGLDRIYFRGPMRSLGARTCRLRASKMASDHLPVIADLEMG